MSHTSLRARLKAYVLKHDHVSFAEIMREFPETRGDIAFGTHNNMVLWSGLTSECLDAVDSLFKSGEIHFAPAGPFTYVIDGEMLKLPQVRNLKAKYRKPHWLPVTLRPGPMPEEWAQR